MPDPFAGIRQKLLRTEHLFKALDRDVIAYRKRDPYAPLAYFNADTRELGLLISIREPCSLMWGVQIGEIVHNLRSALDHLVWEIVIKETGHPPVTKKTQFPIFQTEDGFNDRGVKTFLAGVSPSSVALIKSLQPFSTGEDVRSPLWHLLQLSDFDKHRTLHVTAASLEGGSIDFPTIRPGIKILRHWIRVPGPLEDRALLASATLSGTGWPFIFPEGEVKVQGPMRLNVAFDGGCEAVAGAGVTGTLAASGTRVYETCERISAEIFGITL